MLLLTNRNQLKIIKLNYKIQLWHTSHKMLLICIIYGGDVSHQKRNTKIEYKIVIGKGARSPLKGATYYWLYILYVYNDNNMHSYNIWRMIKVLCMPVLLGT